MLDNNMIDINVNHNVKKIKISVHFIMWQVRVKLQNIVQQNAQNNSNIGIDNLMKLLVNVRTNYVNI